MKYLRTLACAVVATSLIGQLNAQSLGAASDFNYFVFGDVTLSNTDAEGRVAIGGNGNFSNYGIGDKLPQGSSGYSLVVDGNLSYQGGQVFHGDVIYGGSLSANNFTVANGSTSQGNPIDFSAAKTELSSFSQSLGGLATNGNFQNEYGTLIFTGTDATLNTFDVQASAINSAHGFQVNAPSGSTVVINVGGKSVSWNNMTIWINSVSQNNVLYNFYEAETIALSGIGINGSILAPNADVIFNNGQQNGTLVAKSLNGTGEFHHHLFEGNLPPAIPEPSTWISFIASCMLLTLRRRRRND